MKFNLPARKPFNFLSVVNSHGWRQLAPFSFDENTNTLSHILRLSNGHVVELRLRDGKDGVTVETEKLNKSEQKEVADKVTWMFGLDMDFSLFYAASRGEPKLPAKASRERSWMWMVAQPGRYNFWESEYNSITHHK